MICLLTLMLKKQNTGLHKKDKTSETTVRFYTFCFLTLMILCNSKRVSFFAKSIDNLLKDRRFNQTLGSSESKSFFRYL